MEINLINVTLRDLAEDYEDNEEQGVIGYSGKLNIRPAYQREFVYKDAQRNLVIDSVSKRRPLNVMYWADNEDGTYEVIDGQQRTISICQFINNDFSIEFEKGIPLTFANLPKDKQEEILNYSILVYICKGTASEKLEWFRIINIAGEVLTEQELLNANYTGRWLADAKRKFSKNTCVAYKIGSKLLNGTPNRQDYLEEALYWISNGEKNGIPEYMAKHQHDTDALELWSYFQNVIEWVNAKFPKYRKEMKGLHWGLLYNKYKDNRYDSNKLEKAIVELMRDDDVTSKKGVYEYLLSGREIEKVLSIRKFTDTQKRTAYEQQDGVCPLCGEKYEFEEMEGDHITPWHLGGKTTLDNLQMICKKCNRKKSGK